MSGNLHLDHECHEALLQRRLMDCVGATLRSSIACLHGQIDLLLRGHFRAGS